ncbi:methylthioribulose 1-phosphate dehydratase [Alicyclobacillus fastidiosus]|uniref:Methylthioribulose-1-phosphate dehydratase n=1 Tax=Alicyclobacillus fastidiosus TaxID=392011 RepID=A0ABV5AE17_9BACL|nr:methylthioribulose 1-phosphate dehydratase [Alicyclobacillus fastidiosus]WEH09894.1 methylthioribulose 1-phosphate dehydratase [Alicyclobacillus fastidiosus]
MTTFEKQAQTVASLAQFCSDKGWLPATSGNLSVLVDRDPLAIAITRSGADKQRLQVEDVLLIDDQMQVQSGSQGYRPSAETSVHIELYQKFSCGSILHVHTVFNNLVSELYGDVGAVLVRRHELLKALGHWEEDAEVRIPIVPNYADLTRLGEAVAEVATADVPAVLVRNHGIYAWGETAQDARRHLEAVEFLCEYLYRLGVSRVVG